jgi:hypothetical protein
MPRLTERIIGCVKQGNDSTVDVWDVREVMRHIKRRNE